MNLIWKLIAENNRTIYFNFKYFPFNQAIKFPVILARNIYLMKVKGEVIIDCDILSYGMITIGLGKVGIIDDKKARAMWEVSGAIVFKGAANLGPGSRISVGQSGKLVLGNNFKVTGGSSIVVHRSVQFGQNCLLSWDILVMDRDFHNILDERGRVSNVSKPIAIGNNIWIGCRCLILKGTVIADNSIVAAGAVVNKKFTEGNLLLAGVPAKIVNTNMNWK